MVVQSKLEEYLRHAMLHAVYRRLDDGSISGTIPVCLGVIEFGATEQEAREHLQSALRGWVELGLKLDHGLPEIDGIRIIPRQRTGHRIPALGGV